MTRSVRRRFVRRSKSPVATTSTPTPKFFPTSHQVSLVRSLLTSCFRLPGELVFLILDYADYMPALTARMAKPTRVSNSRFIVDRETGAMALLVTDPIPKGAKVKSVKWWMHSNDQGWSEERRKGTYYNSWTWFEAGILRPSAAAGGDSSQDAIREENGGGKGPTAPKERIVDRLKSCSVDLLDLANQFSDEGCEEVKVQVGNEDISRWLVQRNVQSSDERRENGEEGGERNAEGDGVLTASSAWNRSGKGSGKGFLEALREGDRVMLVGRSMFPLWVNHVSGAEVEVRYWI
ncbi:hypothetical protein BDZ91DRAFT_724902 [Kalaharituber pfeilii]|nr:hypothetical protein BDZ91DRAFT_724902 [Kalaharituber pfeilii]